MGMSDGKTKSTGQVRSLARALNLLQQYEAATEWARRAILEPRSAGGGYWSQAILASALGNLGQIAEAREAVDEAM